MEVDWDLHAVVRAYCCSTASSSSSSSSAAAPTTTTATVTAAPTYNQHNRNSQDETFLGFFPDPFQTRNERFLNNLNNPLEFPKLQKPPPYPQSLPISPLSVIGGLQDPPLNLHHQHHQQKQIHGKQQSFSVSRCTTSNAQSTRSKKRKNQMKKVCQVPAEGLSSDVWSWRKYGQKPIKGSPYPRGYYKCSTSKGCLARKQVERNRSDPDMFILTYTGDHSHPVPTHRNSLAGSTRTKPTTTTTTSGDDDDTTQTKPTSSPPVSPPASQSPATEKTEDNDTDDDDTFDTIMDDDFFEGLDELVRPVAGEAGANSPATSFPWLSNTTTAAGGS